MTALAARIAAVNDVLCAQSVLTWDSRTMMPPGGATTRSRQIATLAGLARDLLVAPETGIALAEAERQSADLPEDHPTRRATAATRAAYDFHRRIPADLVARRAEARGLANAAWVHARATNDFALFAPYLQRNIDLARDFAHTAGWTSHPYDALLALYEPGETVASLRTLFAALKSGIAPILAAARARAPRTDFLTRAYPEPAQRDIARHFASLLGYDTTRGRLDTTIHPFEVSFTREDVRITTRYRPDAIAPALFGAMHETGHALYEQNVDPAYTGTALATDLIGLYAVGGTSFGAHESQSRLQENHLGRSLPFWQTHFPTLQKAFPDALSDVTAEEFHAGINAARPGLIRTEADELTYDLHIILRTEIEASLIDGSLQVADIPKAWAQTMHDLLGLDVPTNREGCLQDIHWSSGMIGSFCSYTIGNVMAAQLMAAVPPGADLTHWLRENIWTHGRRFTRDELLVRATGSALTPEPYLAYLRKKFQ
jgi:carboxypeptidase Taq